MPGAEADIVIVGAGPAGLSAAIAADRAGAEAIVLEAADEVGGLTRSFLRDGYTFDCSGHLLHLSHPEATDLVEKATAGHEWNRIERDSVIYMQGAIVPYPFQLHLAHAPARVREECLRGLPETTPPRPSDPAAVNFAEWIERNLGPGIGSHFMVPYNEKLSTVAVSELTCEWLGRFVPQPGIEEIRRGATESRTVQTGYNRSFRYPAKGGIGIMSRSLAELVPELRTGSRVVEIDTARRAVRTVGGEEYRFDRGVIATLPLPDLASAVVPSAPVLDRRTELRSNVVTCVNVGIRDANPDLSRYQWIYLPERRFSAYRLGFYKRFAESMAPAGREGLYVEVAHAEDASETAVVEAAVADLLELGVIDQPDAVETVLPVRIPNAYVIHDAMTASARRALHEELAARDIHVAGRYGIWEYSAMEDAIVSGMDAARGVLDPG